MTNEVIEGKTPNGGVVSQIFYSDDEWNPTDKDNATKFKIVEFDENGNEIFATYGFLNNKKKDK